MKKNYHEYEKIFVGSSDMGRLVFAGYKESALINFGEDSSYFAYIVDENAEIGSHYKKVASFDRFVDIYDDTELTKRFTGNSINVYRCGSFGLIIQILN